MEKKAVIKIPMVKVMLIAIVYVCLPIAIFFLGWLKLYISIPICILLVASATIFTKNLKEQLKEKFLAFDVKTVLFLAFSILLWIYLSGIGGFWVERSDLHYRNAVLHDLIDYSWPVVYPETGNALCYYFTYWMVPALVGKLFGWQAANITLFIWSYIGVVLTVLLVSHFLNVNTFRKMLILVAMFVFWSGLCFVAWEIMSAFGGHTFGIGGGYGWLDMVGDSSGYPYAYQYTPNTGLLKWVYNQTIVPWLITIIYLMRRGNIREYAFIGLLMLPYGPIPFIGLFILMICDAFTEVYKQSVVKVLKNSISTLNILAILAIVPAFYLFFKCNVAASGEAGSGGFGLYVPFSSFTFKRVVAIVLFWLVSFGVYSILLYKDNKSKSLFWIVTITLMLIPNLKLGTGRDFCMRASIPALFTLMIMVVENFYKVYDGVLKINCCTILLIITISIAGMSTVGDYLMDINTIRTTQQFPYVCDNIRTLSSMESNVNFLTPDAYERAFFKYLAKEK